MEVADADLRAMFASDAATAVERIADALTAAVGPEARAQIGQDAHRLAGGAAVFGLGELVDAAQRLQALSESAAPVEQVRQATERLRDLLHRADLDGAVVRRRPAEDPIDGHLVVLHVEDEPTNLLLVRSILSRRTDVSLHEATTGAEALALARRIPPDVVLLDLELPDTDGVSVVRAMRKTPAGIRARIVIVTAHDLSAVQERVVAAGADDVLTKPLDVERILAAVRAPEERR